MASTVRIGEAVGALCVGHLTIAGLGMGASAIARPPPRPTSTECASGRAAQLTEVPVEENKKEEVKTGTGRILDMVEKQEQNKEEAEDDTDTGGLKKKDVNARGGRRKKRGERMRKRITSRKRERKLGSNTRARRRMVK